MTNKREVSDIYNIFDDLVESYTEDCEAISLYPVRDGENLYLDYSRIKDQESFGIKLVVSGLISEIVSERTLRYIFMDLIEYCRQCADEVESQY